MTVLLLALSLVAVSCGKDDVVTLVFENDTVSHKAGFQRLMIDATSDWSIGVECKDSKESWVTMDRYEGTPEQTSIRLTYKANETGEDREAVFSVSCGKTMVRYTLRQLAEEEPRTANDWMELPEIDPEATGYRFVAHKMSISGTQTRNFEYYYSYSDRVSLWVAYPLNDWNRGSYYGRSDAWGFDPTPDFLKKDQPDVTSPYSKGNDGKWYNRGHQIPSADRQGSQVLNAPTFYGTNMTPQNGDFNSNLWAHLEGSVRNWASKSDTLYVVTGCVVEGSKAYVKDASSNNVTVPTAYFKALLRYKTKSTIGFSDYAGIAFWFDHAKYSIKSNAELPLSDEMSMSIASLEDKLGYDLFVNLDNMVGEETAKRIKTQDPQNVSWWWNNK